MEKTIVENNGSNVIAKAVVEILKFEPNFTHCKDCGIKSELTHILKTGRCSNCQLNYDMYYYNLNSY